MPTFARIIGLADERLIVKPDAGFGGGRSVTGKPLWYHDADKRLDAVVLGSPGGLLYTQLDPVRGENNWRPAVRSRVDPQTGQLKARTVLETLKHERPKFGPLLTMGERRFAAFFGRGEQDPTATSSN